VGVRTLTLIAVPSDQSRVSMTDPSAPLMALNASNIICAASTSSFRNWSRSPRELSRLPNSALAVDGARRLLPDENIAAAVPLRWIGDCTRCAYRRHFGRLPPCGCLWRDRDGMNCQIGQPRDLAIWGGFASWMSEFSRVNAS
jgi:hypothetical protein